MASPLIFPIGGSVKFTPPITSQLLSAISQLPSMNVLPTIQGPKSVNRHLCTTLMQNRRLHSQVTKFFLNADGVTPFSVNVNTVSQPSQHWVEPPFTLRVRLCIPTLNDAKALPTFYGFQSSISLDSVWRSTGRCVTKMYHKQGVWEEQGSLNVTHIEVGSVNATLPESPLSRCRWLDASFCSILTQEIIVDDETVLLIVYELDGETKGPVPSAKLIGFQEYLASDKDMFMPSSDATIFAHAGPHRSSMQSSLSYAQSPMWNPGLAQSCRSSKISGSSPPDPSGRTDAEDVQEWNTLLCDLDPDRRQIDVDRILCKACDKWIGMSTDDHILAQQQWLSHRTKCHRISRSSSVSVHTSEEVPSGDILKEQFQPPSLFKCAAYLPSDEGTDIQSEFNYAPTAAFAPPDFTSVAQNDLRPTLGLHCLSPSTGGLVFSDLTNAVQAVSISTLPKDMADADFPADGPPIAAPVSAEATSIASNVSKLTSPVDAADVDTLPDRREQRLSMVHGRDITVHDGIFTNVAGDYHEHKNVTVFMDMEQVSETFDFLKGTFSKLDDLVSVLQNKSTGNDNEARQTMTSSEKEETNSSDKSNENELRFNSLNDPAPPSFHLDKEYIIYETSPTPTTYSSRLYTHSGLFPSTSYPQISQQLYPYDSPVFPPQTVHYLPYWYTWFASWIAWMSPHSWQWPVFA